MAMRNIDISLKHYQIRNIKKISEQEIIHLQDVFLTNGFHNITVQNILQGRLLVAKFIQALNYYRSVACLTSSTVELETSIFDIYKYLSEFGNLSNQKLFEFFNDQFYFDFLFIESTKELMHVPWALEFQRQLLDFKFDKTIPIICFSYSKLGG